MLDVVPQWRRLCQRFSAANKLPLVMHLVEFMSLPEQQLIRQVLTALFHDMGVWILVTPKGCRTDLDDNHQPLNDEEGNEFLERELVLEDVELVERVVKRLLIWEALQHNEAYRSEQPHPGQNVNGRIPILDTIGLHRIWPSQGDSEFPCIDTKTEHHYEECDKGDE